MNIIEFRSSVINALLDQFNVKSSTRKVIGDNIDLSQDNVQKGQILNTAVMALADIEDCINIHVNNTVSALSKQITDVQKRMPRRGSSPAALLFLVDQMVMQEKNHIMPGFMKIEIKIPFYTTASVDRLMKFKI